MRFVGSLFRLRLRGTCSYWSAGTSVASSQPAVIPVPIRPTSAAVQSCNRLKRASETLYVALSDLTVIALD